MANQRPVIALSSPRHREESSTKHREAAAQAHLADFWEVIGHTASREIATSLIAPCRRPRPVGAMTKKREPRRSVAPLILRRGFSMSGGLGSEVGSDGLFGTHTPSLRGVFDEAISRVSGMASDTLPHARWASPLLRGATSLIAPCRRPRPVGAMTVLRCSAVASLQYYSVLQRGDCVPPHVHSSSVPSRLWLPLPTDGCEATSSITHLGEGGG